jgi:hypothetical protein
MVTHSTSHVSDAWYEQKNGLDIRETVVLKKSRSVFISWHQVMKWFGIISTVLLSAAALAPDAFGIPANLQPWVFLTAIFWVLAFCAGMFDL